MKCNKCDRRNCHQLLHCEYVWACEHVCSITIKARTSAPEANEIMSHIVRFYVWNICSKSWNRNYLAIKPFVRFDGKKPLQTKNTYKCFAVGPCYWVHFMASLYYISSTNFCMARCYHIFMGTVSSWLNFMDFPFLGVKISQNHFYTSVAVDFIRYTNGALMVWWNA